MKEIIKKMAHLARLSFPEKDLARYTEKVSAVLEYVDQLKALDTKDIQPMSHAVEVTGDLREDTIVDPMSAQEIITAAPDRDGMFYQVPRVIEE